MNQDILTALEEWSCQQCPFSEIASLSTPPPLLHDPFRQESGPGFCVTVPLPGFEESLGVWIPMDGSLGCYTLTGDEMVLSPFSCWPAGHVGSEAIEAMVAALDDLVREQLVLASE